MSLDQLISKCKRNNLKAQTELYTLYSSKLYAVCLKYSRNTAEAQDNLHDAFLTIFSKISQYKNKGSFEGWMKRITINTALQRYREKGVFNIINEDITEEAVEVNDYDDISLDFLLGLIQTLPNRYRMVFNLYVLDGYSHKEIAEMLKISVGTSKSNLARARLILQEKIDKANLNLESHSI
ncbi:RNA polymerase ECF-type sigma factor [Formosa agariphila KMM 3901]|uniref:RNA polymerase ECF-type sigma factor n=1 Tax=Formosa agariphila (strain DSM 15362 / KCTC 12365 / LMG 23005 / KMM 3901 / M-2Alg 35-1) TaxID=1347342 RepID=T2KR09_FORAG|nr:RNA polymerase sigma factor [Formosa agariphila]CDF81170.1 RNA polymerase ECF-type sigma factor [Formosa agariphila KMM 3901]